MTDMTVHAQEPPQPSFDAQHHALVVEKISSGYERTTVIRDVSFSVPKSSVVALLGPNGAGKTTLLKTISGLLEPWQGSISIDGVDATKMRPHQRVKHGLCHIPEGRYYLILAALVITAAVMIAIHESRLGRLLRGMSESPLAVSTLGLNLTVTRAIVFCTSAFFAAIGGSLYGQLVHFSSSSDPMYASLYSLILVATLIIAPFREPWYVLPAALGTIIPAYWTSGDSTSWLNAIFGFFAIVVSLQGGPPVMPESWREPLTRLFTTSRGRSRHTSNVAGSAPAHPAPRRLPGTSTRQRPTRTGLRATGLTVRFGGLVAVSDLTISVPLGRITGLIGPNGAGKTTTFNACNGLNRPAAGTVELHGIDVSRKSPAVRARLGMGRTFQRMELCDGLSVAENVALGREAPLAGSGIIGQMVAPRGEQQSKCAATYDAMLLCGLTELAERPVGDLSTGQRRLVELARVLAGPFDVLLLDEPSSGLDRTETAQLSRVLQNVVATRGCGVLLVEHDMNLVLDICDHIYVLDYGKMLFEGSPSEVANSAVVRAAYLGDSDTIADSTAEVNEGQVIEEVARG